MSSTIVGNITRDPELRFSPTSDKPLAICKFGLAENQRKKTKGGQYEDVPNFFDVVCFGDLAENVSESLSKGTRAVVVGQFTVRDYVTKEGEKRRAFELVADEVAPSLRFDTATVQKKLKAGSNVAKEYNERPFTGDDSF